uniref:hypothetical protein n=1 Tax=Acetatifactor sp. TaxID=1872090 RepID=UPI004057B9D1
MKKKIYTFIVFTCIFFSGCGNSVATNIELDELDNEETVVTLTEEAQAETIENVNEETFRTWTINKLGLLDPDDLLDEILPADDSNIDMKGMTWGLSYETVYRFFNMVTEGETLFCIQTLEAPYTEWENHVVREDEWIEGENCIPWKATLTDYGEVHVLLEGSENYYLGKWSLTKGSSAKELECEHQIFMHDNWCVGDEIGNFFLINDQSSGIMHNYRTLWLNSQFKEKEGIPDPMGGHIWMAAETPISCIPYLLGCDENGVEISSDSMSIYNTGFTIWAEGNDTPVFTTEHAGMDPDSFVLFYTDTEGYLFNHGGIWDFSIENQTITSIKNASIWWQDACLRSDDSVLMLSRYYNQETESHEYYLWEMIVETSTES